MANPVFYPSNLQWIGLGKETTYGTVVTPTIFPPVISPKWTPKITPLPDNALRGSMAETYGQVQGLRTDEITYKTYLYLDSLFPQLLGLLGGPDTVTGTADPYTHTTSLLNTGNGQPPSYTITYWDGTEAWQIPGAIVSEVQVAIKADALAEITVTWMGMPGSKAGSAPTNTPGVTLPMPSWNTVITLGGTGEINYADLALTYKRVAKEIPTITGSQSPLAIYSGTFSVKGTLTGVYQAGATQDLASYLVNTQPGLTLTTRPAGDTTHGLILQHTKVAYDDALLEEGGDWVEVKATVTGIANTTDATASGESPVKVQLLNAVSTAY
ncbi:MAG: phage tail tube protein [Dermatophilaceae bacterium]